jgi:glycosyltransferase involved in cell wall biosynthesis
VASPGTAGSPARVHGPATVAAAVPPAGSLRGRRIVVVNWRDLDHPQAGGAEQYAWEMATGLTRRGATVTYLTARGPGQGRHDSRQQVEIVRVGRTFTVYPLALAWLLPRRWRFDAVLDCQNGIPFFTPLVLPRRVPVFMIMHHVHDKQFGLHFPVPMAVLGRILEGPLARRCYRRQACVAVSHSTARAMRERLRWTGTIHVIPNGLQVPHAATAPPVVRHPVTGTAEPSVSVGALPPAGQTITVVGRLVAHKRLDRIADVAERLRGTGTTIEVIGRGPASAQLIETIKASDVANIVRLHGYLTDDAKRAAVAASTLHLNMSHGEGWGLCVLEAAAAGVPTVAYDVDGLRDAVRDGETGWLVRDGERIEDVAERALKELGDPGRRAEVAAACRGWAARFDWDRSAGQLAGLLNAALAGAGPRREGWPAAMAQLDGMPEAG